LTTAVHLFGSVDFVISAQVIIGGSVSLTVTLNEHIDPPEAVHVTSVVPFGKNESEAGAQVTVAVPHALDVGAKLTTAPHWWTSLSWEMFAGQVSTHPALHFPALPAPTIDWISD